MAKIGVITHWRSADNYGQTIQIYALQRALRDKGAECYLIRYARKDSLLHTLLKAYKIHRLYAYILRKRNSAKNKELNKKNHRDLQLFIKSNIALSPREYSRRDLMSNPPEADIYITGSDQVWNILDNSYYLDFAPKSAKKFSYAASFGGVIYENKQLNQLGSLLKSFDAITVREIEGLELCKKAGRPDAILAPDPTFLLSAKEYGTIAIPPRNSDHYVLLYLLGNENKYDVGSCFSFAEKHNLGIKYVAGSRQVDDYPKEYPSMEEWLGLIQNAQYVVTNSFHGTVFALIFNKQFITIPLSGRAQKMNSRIDTLLKTLSLTERISEETEVLLTPIKYQGINMRLDSLREQGHEILSKMI